MLTRWREVLGACLLLLALSLPGYADEQSAALPLTVLHFNDFHGQLEPFTDPTTGASVGGIARLASAVQAVRAEAPQRPVILLFAGDMLQGTVTSSLFFGIPDLGFFSDMGVDAAVMGNHELDYGQDIFRKLLERARFPVLSANVQAEPKPFPLQPYVILHPKHGPRVAVLGLTTTELTTTTHPRNAVGLSVDDPVVVAKRLMPQLKAQAELVVVLSHLGIADDQRLARDVMGVDLVVGGHNHNVYASPVITNGVPIVQAGDRGRYLGRMDLTVSGGHVKVAHYRLIPIEANTPENAKMAANVSEIVAVAEQELVEVIGRASVDLDAQREVIRRRESNFGDWVADLARE
ncbi:MAG: bifunctional UDP-sugar hydrolase/5'-nucleotidase, partial [Candidatus Competibacteraceae bacterium]